MKGQRMGEIVRDEHSNVIAYVLGHPHWPPGIHYYETLLRCPKLAAAPFEDDRIRADGLGIGSLFHAHMHMYYTGVYDDRLGPWIGDVPFVGLDGESFQVAPDAALEAERLARWVAEDGHPGEFGRILQAEERHGIDGSGDPVRETRVREALFGFGESFGWTEDLVVELTQRDVESLALTQGIGLQPGKWIVDHKTERAHTKTLVPQYENSLQFAAYAVAAAAYHGWDDLRGVLAHVVIKKKTPERLIIPISYPDSTMLLALETFFANVTRELGIIQRIGNYPRAGGHCFFPRMCGLFASGECIRG